MQRPTDPDPRARPTAHAGRRLAAGALDLALGVAAGGFGARARWPFAPDLVEASDLVPWRELAASSLGVTLVLAFAALRPAPLLARTGLTWLVGVALGAASALLDPLPGGPAWPWLLAGVVLLAVARAVARAVTGRGAGQDEPSAGPGVRAPLFLGLALAAAGVAEALVAEGRLASRTMPESPSDHTAMVATFAALLVVGAFAFGRPFSAPPEVAPRPRPSDDDGRAFVALVVAAFAAFGSLAIVGGVTSPSGLRALTRRFDLDVSASGTLGFDALVATATFVLTAFAVGAALHLVRTRVAWLALALGAGLGAARSFDLPPLTLEALAGATLAAAPSDARSLRDANGAGGEVTAPLRAPDAGSAGRVLDGLVLAGAGALVVGVLGARGRRRVASCAAGAAAVALATQVEVAPIRVLKAFERFQPTPLVIAEGQSGQYVVDPGGVGLERLTLDQRALAPTSERARGDRDQLRASFALLPAATRERGARVLLLGPLTPGRARTLADLGARVVDRSAGYARDLAALEAYLARDLPQGVRALTDTFTGEVVAPHVARHRARTGAYDLVVVPAGEGNRADARFLATPEGATGTAQVLWLEAADDGAHRAGAARVLLATSGAEHPVLGLVHGATPTDDPTPGGAAHVPLAAAAAAARQLTRLGRTEDARRAANELAFAARFERGAVGTPWADLAVGLARHLAAQRPSSPFETPAQRVELDRDALDRLFAHGTLGPPDLLTRGLWDGLVAVLRAKREVALTYELVEPLAELWAPWPEGALALAWADGEELDHEGAVARLRPLVAAAPEDRALALGLADVFLTAERPAEAAEVLAGLVALAPGERGLRKALARAQIAAKDPAGRTLALELLREDPEDRELWGLLGPLAGAQPALAPPRQDTLEPPRDR